MRAWTLVASAAAALTIATTLATGSAVAATTCFGAPARDPAHPCVDRRRSVTPSVATREKQFESPCWYRAEGPLTVCLFGSTQRKGHVALIGDSHAWHWRAAVDYVAKRNRWLGYSVTAGGCSYSEAVAFLPGSLREACTTWFERTKTWLLRHPEVTTVFVSHRNWTEYEVPPGQTAFGLRVAGFQSAWATALPATVKHVVVIADVPKPRLDTFVCIKRVLVRKGNPGTRCATPRSASLSTDAGGGAVQAMASPRFRFVDFTPFFCTTTSCLPVVGGALVYRDAQGHITPAFARTVGPYLLRRVQGMGLP